MHIYMLIIIHKKKKIGDANEEITGTEFLKSFGLKALKNTTIYIFLSCYL